MPTQLMLVNASVISGVCIESWKDGLLACRKLRRGGSGPASAIAQAKKETAASGNAAVELNRAGGYSAAIGCGAPIAPLC